MVCLERELVRASAVLRASIASFRQYSPSAESGGLFHLPIIGVNPARARQRAPFR
jgi:hypothetical protein